MKIIKPKFIPQKRFILWAKTNLTVYSNCKVFKINETICFDISLSFSGKLNKSLKSTILQNLLKQQL
jgi:hypothetical protein